MKFQKVTLKVVYKLYVTYKTIRLRLKMARGVWTVKLLAIVGDPESQAILGAMYSIGIGVVKDDSKSFRWFYRAAEQGYSRAQFIVGIRYATGIGVARNHAEALKWFYEAERQRFPKAQIALELMNVKKVITKDYLSRYLYNLLFHACVLYTYS